ncbi:MAG: guanylate kinase [Porphyromonas sp.]|jgi:guanylate kinase|nr:guanylate kinase [uncultured Porphyromonas sp.]
MGKLIIISAPSGTGKSTLISRLLSEHPELRLRFSVSATSRAPRGQEQHGVEYYFFSPEEFRAGIERGDFLEYEEVYPGRYYGTLRSEVDRRIAEGDRVIFDVDCVGGVNIKEAYGAEALSLFIQPPSLEELRRRLVGRQTDSPEVIEERLAKAELELSYAQRFDRVLVNDDLERCYQEFYETIRSFLSA